MTTSLSGDDPLSRPTTRGVNLDLAWLKDPALDDVDSLLAPEVMAQEIVEDLQAALAEFEAIAEALGAEVKPNISDAAIITAP